jgi:4'-phosphopantetheinyl transferase
VGAPAIAGWCPHRIAGCPDAVDITVEEAVILPLELPSDMVHLWYMSVTDTRILLDNHLSVLDEEEKYRANRFHFDRDRIRFILARGSLRHLLARYTGFDPALIRFKQNPYGKPFLQHPHSPVQFTVTHSGGCIVHAIACGTQVGVDVELVRDSTGLASVASYFAAGEQAWLRTVDPQERDVRFFTLWVCKEAYIKALGRGLSKSLDSFEISLETRKGRKEGMEGIEPVILSDSENCAASASWRLVLFKPGEDMLGCLAINSATKIVELREYGAEQIMYSLS